jgi:hypothetical protein
VCEEAISVVKKSSTLPNGRLHVVYAIKQRGAAKYYRENSVIISRGEFRGFYGFYGTTAVSTYKRL